MKVLLVDDEVELVTTLAERLSMRDIETDWATDARKALELAENNDYAIAILDVRIPGGIDGFQLKKLLEEKRPGMKFMFYTGHGTEETYRRGISETDEQFFILKPADVELIAERVFELLRIT